MKVLFYGACWATVFKRIFDKYALGEHHFDVLTNFVLTSKKIPFAYDSLSQYDAVVFNPILDKGEWNTSHLEAACRINGIRTFRFSWLDWAGYWPDAIYRKWGNHNEWCMPALHNMAVEHSEFDDFYERLFSADDWATSPSWTARATQRLRDSEIAQDIDFPLADWIDVSHKNQHVFVSPNHAGTALYQYLAQQIGDALGIRLDPGFSSVSLQFQSGSISPILPGIGKALGLKFSATEWCHHLIFGKNIYGLREYAMSYHEQSKIVLACSLNATAIKNTTSRAVPGDKRVPKGARLLFRLMPDVTNNAHLSVLPISSFGSEAQCTRQYIYSPHWMLTSPQLSASRTNAVTLS